jgi:uncharacterized protein YuzB (UPF0349 family)
VKLKLCANNRLTVPAAKRLEREFPRLPVHIAACLRKCGPCKESLVAVLDGETIRAANVEDLVQQLRQLVVK